MYRPAHTLVQHRGYKPKDPDRYSSYRTRNSTKCLN